MAAVANHVQQALTAKTIINTLAAVPHIQLGVHQAVHRVGLEYAVLEYALK